MNKLAIPVAYLDNDTKIGSVNIVASKGPPLTVIDWKPEDGNNKHVAIEFEDFTKNFEFPNLTNPQDAVLRICMHLADARKLTHHLISKLAESGDRVAKLIQEKMNESMHSVRALDSASIASCNIIFTEQASKEIRYSCSIESNQANSQLFHETIIGLLKLIRKYAEIMEVLVKINDNQNVLDGTDYKSIIDPFNAPTTDINDISETPIKKSEMTEAVCIVGRDGLHYSETILELRYKSTKIIFRTTEATISHIIAQICDIAHDQNLSIRISDPKNLLGFSSLSFFKKMLGDRCSDYITL